VVLAAKNGDGGVGERVGQHAQGWVRGKGEKVGRRTYPTHGWCDSEAVVAGGLDGGYEKPSCDYQSSQQSGCHLVSCLSRGTSTSGAEEKMEGGMFISWASASIYLAISCTLVHLRGDI